MAEFEIISYKLPGETENTYESFSYSSQWPNQDWTVTKWAYLLDTVWCHNPDRNTNLHHCGHLNPFNTQRMSTILTMEGNNGEKSNIDKMTFTDLGFMLFHYTIWITKVTKHQIRWQDDWVQWTWKDCLIVIYLDSPTETLKNDILTSEWKSGILPLYTQLLGL